MGEAALRPRKKLTTRYREALLGATGFYALYRRPGTAVGNRAYGEQGGGFRSFCFFFHVCMMVIWAVTIASAVSLSKTSTNHTILNDRESE